MSNTILVASSYPNPVAHAAQRAAMLAQALHWQRLELLSVIPPAEGEDPAAAAPETRSEGRNVSLARCMNDARTAAATALLRYGLRCPASFEFGSLLACSLRRAIQARPEGIVLAWQAHPWWPVLHNFNLMRELARGGACPVFLVRQEPLRPYAHAVFASDFSPGSLDTLKRAAQLLPATRITVVHSYQVPGQGHMRAAGVRNDAIDACRHAVERDARAAYARTVAELQTDTPKLTLALLPRPAGLSVPSYVNAVGADLVILSAGQGWLVDEWCRHARLRDVIGNTASDLLMIATERRT